MTATTETLGRLPPLASSWQEALKGGSQRVAVEGTDAEEEGERYRLGVEVRPRASGQAQCSGYDRLPPRRYRLVSVLGLPTFFVYAMRRVDCPCWGKVKVDRVPWADGKQRSSRTLD